MRIERIGERVPSRRRPHVTGFEIGLGLQSDKRPEQYEAIARTAERAGVDVADCVPRPALPARDRAAPPDRACDRTDSPRPRGAEPVHAASRGARGAGGSARHRLGRPRLPRPREGSMARPARDRRGAAARCAARGRRDRPAAARRRPIRIRRRALLACSGRRARTTSRSEPEIPLLVGTWRSRTAEWAATVASEIKLGGCANPDFVRLAREWTGGRIAIVTGAVTVVDEDGDAARARARAEVAPYLEVVAHLDPTLELRPGDEPRSTGSRSPGRRRRSRRTCAGWWTVARRGSSSGRRRG